MKGWDPVETRRRRRRIDVLQTSKRRRVSTEENAWLDYQILLRIFCQCTKKNVWMWGAGFPYPFSKIEKSALILGKNFLIVVIYGLNFSFKMQFLRVSRRKNRRFFPAWPFFFVLYMIDYQRALIPRKSSALKNSWFRAWIFI